MRTYIFTDRERCILEAYLTGGKVSSIEVSKIMHRIRKHGTLFDDVYLYLRVRKAMTACMQFNQMWDEAEDPF